MKMKGRMTKRIIAVIVCAALIVAALPAGIFSALGVSKAKLQVTVISDIHYYPDTLKGTNADGTGFSDAWNEWSENGARQHDQVNALLDAALKKAEKEGSRYVLIPGDLTYNGEYEGHKTLAARLEKFEKDTGIDVIVINGNHDINNSRATSFANGTQESAKKTSPEDFREIYANLGYDLADATYTPSEGKAGMLSYTVKLDGGYRLIVMDTCKYSSDVTADGTDEQETSGSITPELMKWVLEQCEKANKNGETIVGMCHHNFVPHMTIEDEIFGAFVYDNWMETTETLADAGMHFAFSGHLHTPDIASHVNDNGETLYDIETPSLSGFPNKFRTVTFDNTGDDVRFEVKTHDIDEDEPLVANGVTYEQPYRYTYSFFKTYGPGGVKNFAMNAAGDFIVNLFEEIQETGGLYEYLVASGIDIEQIIVDALGTNGLEIGSVEFLTVSTNLMGFIKDLCAQVDEAYINNPDRVLEIVDELITKILNYECSDYQCTKFYEIMGLESKNEKGTLEDLANSVLLTLYSGDEDISDDPFLQDTLDYFENRDGAKELINFLLDTIIEDLLEDEILSTLEFRPGQLFPEGSVTSPVGVVVNILMEIIFRGDTSYNNVIYSVLNLLPEEYSSIRNILNTVLIDEYMTQSQYDSIGYTVGRMLRSLVEDTNPDEKSDLNVTLVYDGKVEPEVTVENYRLPSNIGLTFGDDSATQRSINWYTKYSVKGTDIQIVPYSENPVFADELPDGVKIETTTETVSRSYPGVDLGVIGFIPKTFNMVRHTAEITGLEPGTKYSYRVGDKSRGWWSDAGVIETADKSDGFTFFHVTDEQSQNAIQYQKWGSVVDTALSLFPQGKFFMSTGDQVDYTEHFTQWSWFFNASANIKNSVIMPTAGNHEDEGYMLDQNFILPTTVEQDREIGVFYSFDYNNAHFIVLNTNNLSEDEALSDDQLAWLKADAEKSDAQWTIVALHKALYSNGSHYDDDDVVAMREQLCGLMPELGIDLVLQGHDHVYLRTDVMDDNKVVPTEEQTVTFGGREYSMKLNPEGTVYVISACAGVKTYLTKDVSDTDKLFPRAEKLYDATDSVFSAITIDGDKLYFDAYMLDDEAEGGAIRIDSFALSKAAKDEPAAPGGDDDSDVTDPTNPGDADKPSESTDKPSNSTENPLDTDKPSDAQSTDKPADSKPAGESTDAPDTGVTVSVSLITLAGAAFVVSCATRRKKES